MHPRLPRPMKSGTANLLQMLEARVKELCHQEKWDEAVHAAETAVRKAREVGEAEPDIVSELALSLEVKGLRQIGRVEDALNDYREGLELLDGREAYQEQIARINASVAVILDDHGDAEGAKAHYRYAISIFEAMDPPSDLDVADLSNNLAFLFEAEGDYDEAESLLLRALKLSHDLLGTDNAETASICNNLGTLYQKTRHFERAKEMHCMALKARESQHGENHPDTGQSHANLAVALAETRLYVEAKKHFELAMVILERNIEKVPVDYETVALNYVQFLQAIGDKKGALQVAKRSTKRIKKLLRR